MAELKKSRPRDETLVTHTEAALARLLKEAREAAGRAESIENAVYDLKAVNPHRKSEVETRTPAHLLEQIEAKGKEIAEAIAQLRLMA